MPIVRLQNRRDTAANWTTNNPVLSSGELGFETDTGKFKMGDGSTAWSSLPYYDEASAFATASHTHPQSDITDLTTDLAAKGDASFMSGEIETTVSTTTTYQALTGSSVTVEAGRTYEIRYRLRTFAAAATTGIRTRRILGGGAAGNVRGMHYLMMTNASTVMGRSSREGTNDPGLGLGTATNTTASSGTYWVDVLFVCTTGGTFGLEVCSEVAASSTVSGDGSYWTAISRVT